MSGRYSGYDDDYGYKNEDTVARGGDNYAKERAYHDKDYHEDGAVQKQRYDADRQLFERTTTSATRSKYSAYFPDESLSKGKRRALEHARTSVVKNSDDWGSNERKRKEATQDNRSAAYGRYQNQVQSQDYAYSEDHVLYGEYALAENRRNNPRTGSPVQYKYGHGGSSISGR